MAAYFIVNVEVKDAAGYEEYRKHTLASLQPFDGKFIVRGGSVEVIEGHWQPKRLVVLEFPNLERAKSWYGSPEYQELAKIRQRTSETDMVLVEGV